jgi:hypothetical protein
VLHCVFLDGFETDQVCEWRAAVGSGDICQPGLAEVASLERHAIVYP